MKMICHIDFIFFTKRNFLLKIPVFFSDIFDKDLFI